MTDTRVTEIDLPSVVGWEWTSFYEDFAPVAHQIVWPRGTNSLSYSTKVVPDGTWSHTSINSPERFGLDGTLKGARAAAYRFIDDGSAI